MTATRTALAICALPAVFLACIAGPQDPTAAKPPKPSSGQNDRGPGSGTHPDPGDPTGDDRGAVWYRMLCASCHGDRGEGGMGLPLDRWTRSRGEMVGIISERMPLGNPGRCKNDCAERVADYILSELQLPPINCDRPEYPPRQLRLLSRSEYRNTVRDLFASVRPPACTRNADCALTESCRQSACARDACSLRTFTFDPGGRSAGAIVVAGSFNAWAPTAAQGGWPLSFDPARRTWITKHEVANGTHSYKFVIDGSTWVTDPLNPDHQPDGFGGNNSILTVACPPTPQPPAPSFDDDPTVSFPAESRPPGYFFDNDAAAGLVTAVHASEYLKAAEHLAKAATDRLDRLVACDPSRDRALCTRQLVERFGKRALRRPLTPEEIAKYIAIADARPTFESGARALIQVMLSSPSFLYRSELGAADPAMSGPYRLSAYEIAGALSYLFWGTMPDDLLFEAAGSGRLDDAAGIEHEARRLLADPKSREVIGRFALEWLGAENILTTDKRPALFPTFSDEVRRAMAEETKAFVAHVVFDSSHRFEELFTADYAFLNADLARIYGMSGVSGTELRKVSFGDEQRRGILGQGSILGTYAHSDQSSPIRRGVFVRERLLCQKFAVPPPNAGMLPPVDPNATARERFSMHSANDACRSCHGFIDPIGFGLEHFDAIGQYRERENGHPIDARGDISDLEGFGKGTHAPFSTIPELARIIAGSPSAKACFAKQVYRFARGNLESAEARCELESITRRFSDSGNDIRELLIAITQSPGFVLRR